MSRRYINAPLSMSASVSRSIFLASKPAACTQERTDANKRAGDRFGKEHLPGQDAEGRVV
jgi:hypothetical protein